MSGVLTGARFAEAVAELVASDRDLARVVDQFGPPVPRRRKQGFATLMLLILEQQVSLASARATYRRLEERLGGALEPDRFLALDDAALKGAGLSRQKARYGRALAGAVADGGLRLGTLARLDDDGVRARLTAITGIGAWTADVYLMMALRRPDIWPVGDLALAVAVEKVKRLPARPDQATLVALGEAWRPWRAVAARILWHYYLNTIRNQRGQTPA
ncbi:MAG: DNA-3-methyladenine glycosylase 2 family protein [Alphaproteobacteria bacterium]